MLQCIKVSIQFIIQTAFQSSALSAQLCLVDRKVLVTGSGRIYRFEFTKPCGATKFTTAASNATHLSAFLSCPDLAHLHFQLKLGSINFYQLTEINPAISDIKESGFTAISLHLHFA